MAVPKKPVLSPTRFLTYLECPMKYRYIYVDRIGRFYLHARPQFSLGTAVHRALQAFHAEGTALSQEELMERLHQSWVPAGFADRQEEEAFRQAAQEMIAAYHSVGQARAEAGVQTLLLEKVLRTDMGRFLLMGRVDRVDRHADGSLEIVDYKSGRLTVAPEDVASDLAMGIYQLILRRLYPGARVFATIYCLRSGVHASAEMAPHEAEEFSCRITELGEEIAFRDYEGEGAPVPLRISACSECPFLRRCEAFWRRA
ncbi:MAG: RecB family exonuclease [Chthonomonadales bacterium]